MGAAFSRRAFVKTIACAAAGAIVPGCASAQSAHSKVATKPNILFIMVDDLGKEWVECYGGEKGLTPHVDQLAAGGMKFTNAYSMPQCTPTRTTLLTGQYPWRHGWVNHWDVPRWGAGCHFDPKYNLSFARVLKTVGYKTCAAGKWQINDFRVQPDAMVQHGFDEFCMWTGYETGNPPSSKRYQDAYIHTASGSKTYTGKFGPDVYCDFIIDFMKRNKSQPMCLYFPMALVHHPLVATPDEPGATGSVEKHKAMVRYTDKLLGRLVKTLDELKIRDRTLIFWTTDNGTGGMVGSIRGVPVRGGKAKDTENGICEPFIVNCPGRVPAGVTTDALTDFTDMMPTFAELAGATIPMQKVLDHTIDGHSIARLITGRAKDSTRQWIMAMGHGPAKLDARGVRGVADYFVRVVRDKRYKLWVDQPLNVKGNQPKALYDLAKDPFEKNNLVNNTDRQIIAAKKKLIAIAAKFPEKDARPKYDPLPPQPWDKKLKKKTRTKKKGH